MLNLTLATYSAHAKIKEKQTESKRRKSLIKRLISCKLAKTIK